MVLCGLATLAWGAPVSAPMPKPNTPPPPKKPAITTPAKPSKPHPITIIPQDGFNLRVAEQLDPHYVIVELTSPAHNWFAGTFTNLPTDKDVTIGLSMTGNDTNGNRADVSKWDGLVPVMTYADPTKYESYEWFQKVNGRWESGDPLKQRDARYAGTGKLPIQSAIPKEIAEQFLAKDGTYWQPWREVDSAEAVTGANVFRVKQRFARATATLAMRVPYTYTFLQSFLLRLKAAKVPGVTIDEVGMTPGKRKLQIIRCAPVEMTVSHKPTDHLTVLLIAREHATEQASSWVTHGVIQQLLQQSELRKQASWLIMPIEDPDGAAQSIFDRLTDAFCRPHDANTPPEVFALTRYLADYVMGGHTIGAAISLHGIEATEGPNFFAPFLSLSHQELVSQLNQSLFQRVSRIGVISDNAPPPQLGWASHRLYGWCAAQYGSLDFAYEVNDRFPGHRLPLQETQAIGAVLCQHFSQLHDSAEAQRVLSTMQHQLDGKRQQRASYFTRSHRTPAKRSPSEVLLLGY